MILMASCKFSVFLLSLFLCRTESTKLHVAVFFNGAKFTGLLNATFVKNSFEIMLSILKTHRPVHFQYTDLNSSFCNLRKVLLSLIDTPRSPPFELVVVMDHCSCERKLSHFVKLLNIAYVSCCSQPLMTVNGSFAVLRHTRQYQRHFLVIPRNADGVEYYKRLSDISQHKKSKINRTFWLSKAEDLLGDELQKVLRSLLHDFQRNITSGASFILALKESNIVLLNTVLNMARMELNQTFAQILWVFPHINSHLEISSLFSAKERVDVVAFHDYITTVASGGNGIGVQAVRAVVERTFEMIQRKERNHVKFLDEGVETVVNKMKESCSFSLPEFDEYKHRSFDILKMETRDLFEGMNWKRIATWNGETFQLCSRPEGTSNLILRQSRRVFRVPIVEYTPFVIKHALDNDYGGGCPYGSIICYGLKRTASNDTVINYAKQFCCSGFTIDVLVYLQNQMSYQFELYFQEEQLYGVRNKENNTWNGVMGDIMSGEGDLAADLVLSPERCIVLGCSQGYIFTGFNVITKNTKENFRKQDSFSSIMGNFQVFLSPFHPYLFITVLMAFNIFLFLIWGTEKVCLHYRSKRHGRNYKFTLLESTSYVWATAFGRDVGDSTKPFTLTARYLSSWLAFLSLIFVNVYVARLTAEFVKEQPSLPFTSLKDPKILDNRIQLGVVKGSAMEAHFRNTRDPVLKKSFENIKRHLMQNLDAGVEAVRNGTIHGFIADSLSLLTFINRDPSCSLSLIGNDFVTVPVGFIFRQHWTWSQDFKLFELNMNERNVSPTFVGKHFNSPSCVSPGFHPQLSIADVSGLFMILTFGIAYCIFSLILENSFSFLVSWWRGSVLRLDKLRRDDVQKNVTIGSIDSME